MGGIRLGPKFKQSSLLSKFHKSKLYCLPKTVQENKTVTAAIPYRHGLCLVYVQVCMCVTQNHYVRVKVF